MLRTLFFLIFAAFVALACGSDPVLDGRPAQSTGPTDPAPRPVPTTAEDALVPRLTSITPDKATVGSVGPSVVVLGENFVARSIVQLQGAPLATTFVSDTELRATIPTAQVAVVALLRVSVGTSAPGGGASKEFTFEVQNAAPALTSLSPLSVSAGAGATTLKLGGTGFVNGAKVLFGTTELVTQFTSAKSVSAVIPAALVAASGNVPVTVVNPAPGGGPSNDIAFTVSNPNAHIQSVSPNGALVGATATTLTVNGGGYVSSSAIVFNGSTLATTFLGSGQLRATVPATSLSDAGDYPVSIQNPPPGGGLSAPVVFRVSYPVPTLTSVSSSPVTVGAGPTEITVTGTGFFPSSQITFDGAPAPTAYGSATELKATLTTTQLASAGAIAIRVINPPPGGGTSTAMSIAVTNGAPTVIAIDPATVTTGSAALTVTIDGSGFIAGSTVQINGATVPSTFVNAVRMTAALAANYFVTPTSLELRVTNPPPGGGASAPRAIVVGCDGAGADVSLASVGVVVSAATDFASASPMPRFAESGTCGDVTLVSSSPQPGRYWVVQNLTGAAVTLSAWADCTVSGKEDDAFLTFYRRPTVPVNTERLSCASVVAEGLSGDGSYSSPESGASPWCPGLTKANGAGLALGVCERVVVHMQPYDVTSTSYPPPPTIKMVAE